MAFWVTVGIADNCWVDYWLPLGFRLRGSCRMGQIIGLHEGRFRRHLVKLGLDNAALFIVVVAVVSLMQWLGLRRVVQRAGFWVLASIIGFTISSSIHGVVCHVYGYPDDLGSARRSGVGIGFRCGRNTDGSAAAAYIAAPGTSVRMVGACKCGRLGLSRDWIWNPVCNHA